ncbi:MAG: hypothetical protein GXP62_00240, partial [Oligoflexia bacterium]|nr:hypothetical protein [Oligoflexia bacterium]
ESPEWRPVRAQALFTLTHLATLQGQPVNATRSLDEARRLLGEDADLADVARIRQLTGNLLRIQGKLGQASDSLAEAADLFSALHRDAAWAACTVSLARIATDSGEAGQAEPLLVQALERYRALRHRPGEADALFVGAQAALARAEWAMADQRFRRAQAIYQRIGAAGIADCRLGRARVALEQDRSTEAARLLNAVRSERPTSRVTRANVQAVALLLAATDADWAAFDQSLTDLAGMQLRGGLGRTELHQIAHTAARLASAHDEPERAARTRVVLGS